VVAAAAAPHGSRSTPDSDPGHDADVSTDAARAGFVNAARMTFGLVEERAVAVEGGWLLFALVDGDPAAILCWHDDPHPTPGGGRAVHHAHRCRSGHAIAWGTVWLVVKARAR
jgi:hypothetical protein